MIRYDENIMKAFKLRSILFFYLTLLLALSIIAVGVLSYFSFSEVMVEHFAFSRVDVLAQISARLSEMERVLRTTSNIYLQDEHLLRALSGTHENDRITNELSNLGELHDIIGSTSGFPHAVAFAMANGLDVERFARNALNLDPRNAAAQIMIAARWIYAPAPFNNFRRGIDMMSVIPQQSNMDKDDRFNVYVAIGYAHIQQRKLNDARIWLERALEVYPTNRFARNLLNQT